MKNKQTAEASKLSKSNQWSNKFDLNRPTGMNDLKCCQYDRIILNCLKCINNHDTPIASHQPEPSPFLEQVYHGFLNYQNNYAIYKYKYTFQVSSNNRSSLYRNDFDTDWVILTLYSSTSIRVLAALSWASGDIGKQSTGSATLVWPSDPSSSSVTSCLALGSHRDILFFICVFASYKKKYIWYMKLSSNILTWSEQLAPCRTIPNQYRYP